MESRRKRQSPGRARHVKRKRIALAFYEEAGMAGELQLGIHEYTRQVHGWQFLVVSLNQSSRDRLAHQIRVSDGAIIHVGMINEGIISRDASEDTGTPVVLIYGGRFRGGPPQVHAGDTAIGQMAAEHLLDRGFQHFAYYPGVSQRVFQGGRGYTSGRWVGFQTTLAKRGFQANRYCLHRQYKPVKVDSAKTMEAVELAVPWLASLPKPVAVFACDDHRAMWISEAAELLGLRVPDDVAILGVNNDQLRCLSASPPLSSIRLPARTIGFEAARMLDLSMQGKPPRKPVLLPPTDVVVRHSTDIIAVPHEAVAEAVRFIREHATGGITPDDAAEAAAVSVSYLEKLFRKHLQRTPFAEIRRMRIAAVKRMLIDTDWSLEEVAERCGFSSGIYLSEEFKKQTSMPPGRFRKQFRRT